MRRTGPDETPATLTLTEAAELLRLSWTTTAMAVLSGDLPRRRQGLRLVVPTGELLRDFGVPKHYLEERHDHDR